MLDSVLQWIGGKHWGPREWLAIIGIGTTALVVAGRSLRWIRASVNSVRSKGARSAESRRSGLALYPEAVVRAATALYIEPRCSTDDPSAEGHLRAVAVVERPLFGIIEGLLARVDGEKARAIVLAGSGMGKTAFMLNYVLRNNSRLRGRQRIFVASLANSSWEDFVGSIIDQETATLFLDAFDEDPRARYLDIGRLRHLLTLTESFGAVVISCRTQFFAKEDEILYGTKLMKVGGVGLGETKEILLQRLYIMPFNQSEILEFARRRYPAWRPAMRRRLVRAAADIPDLNMRPMVLQYLPELLCDRPQTFSSLGELYEMVIRAWLRRECAFADPEKLRAFSDSFAVTLFRRHINGESAFVAAHELRLHAASRSIDLEDWQLRGRSLLVRNAVGEFGFAHRSIMEYLCSRQIAFAKPEAEGLLPHLTDVMITFVAEYVRGGQLPRTADGHARLAHANLRNANLASAALKYARLGGSNLQGADLSGANLVGADLSDANLTSANLEGANLQLVNMARARLRNARVRNADMRGAQLDSADTAETDLEQAIRLSADP